MERADSKSSSNLPGGNGDGASVAKELGVAVLMLMLMMENSSLGLAA